MLSRCWLQHESFPKLLDDSKIGKCDSGACFGLDRCRHGGASVMTIAAWKSAVRPDSNPRSVVFAGQPSMVSCFL